MVNKLELPNKLRQKVDKELEIGEFWLSAKNTAYVITNKRALSIAIPVTSFGNISSTTIRNYPPSKLKDIYRKERADGTGDVVMGIQQSTNNFNNRRNQTTEEIGFMGISNPQEVEKILRQLAEDD